jgi:hypothetical protein
MRGDVLTGGGVMAKYRIKTECPQGHPFTPENTYINPKGLRRCRACQRKRDEARAAELRSSKTGHRVVRSAVDRSNHV